MTQNSIAIHANQAGAPAPSLGVDIYTHPDEVAGDPKLTLAQKRELLASWISDARAVENAPALRRLDSGAEMELDAILRVLVSLDALTQTPRDRKGRSPLPRRRSVMTRWLSRIGPRKGGNDNDDDPPPAPSGLMVPFCPGFVATAAGATKLGRVVYAAG